jgi:L-ribulose-5-phosphate 3-epimerase
LDQILILVTIKSKKAMVTRRDFLKQSGLGAVAVSTISLTPFASIGGTTKNMNATILKLSLAQWSLHRALEAGAIQARDFAKIASQEYGINAIEYVNGFYKAFSKDEKFWAEMNMRALDLGVKNLLIMVDDEGDLGSPVAKARGKAIENHYKWINAAKILGCHSIRVNAFGEGNRQDVRAALIDGMSKLAEYASKVNINIIIENHGLYSSDGKFIVDVMKQVNRPNFGTLPDFGNWCLSAKWGSTQFEDCKEYYDRYQGVKDLLPFAKGVSAKSYKFNAEGNETKIDYYKMLRIVKDSGFDGYIVSARKLHLRSHCPMRMPGWGGGIFFESAKGFLKSCCL